MSKDSKPIKRERGKKINTGCGLMNNDTDSEPINNNTHSGLKSQTKASLSNFSL